MRKVDSETSQAVISRAWGSDLPTRRHAEVSRPVSLTRTHPCRRSHDISADKLARLIGTPKCPALIDVRTEEDFAADPRLIPGAVRRSHEDGRRLGRRIRRPLGHRRLPARARSWPGRRRLAAARPTSPAETLEGGFEAWKAAKLPLVPARKLPPRDAAGPHGLGHARAAEDRPHRLPLADPPLRRSRRRVPVRGAGRGRGRRRALQRRAVRHRGRVLEPSRRALHLRRDGRGVRARDRAAAAAGDDRARRRHRAARPRAGSAGPARRLARPVAHVRRRSRAARGRHGALRRVLSLVPRRHRAKRTTGRPTRRSRECDIAVERDDRPRPMPATASASARPFGSGCGSPLLSLRRAGRADRGDAPHPGRGEALDLREPVPARAELLHAAAGPGGAAARDLYRLAAAPDRGGSSPAACSSCPASSPSWR